MHLLRSTCFIWVLTATTPFAFVKSNEAPFFKFLKLLGCDNAKIGNYKKSVDDRNNSAHSNGRIFFNNQPLIDQKINDVLRNVDDIQSHSKPIIDECLITFLKDSIDPENREYFDNSDQLREILIHGNYLSQKDIEHMLTFDITQLSAETNYTEMEALFNAFKTEYAIT